MNFRVLLAVAWVALLPMKSFTQDVPKRAEALLEHARRLSDIRSPGAPAFRLEATFSFTGTDLETGSGDLYRGMGVKLAMAPRDRCQNFEAH
jgi:hypothetical protein